MNCLWCDQGIIPQISWDNLFFQSKPTCLCDICAGELEVLNGNRCSRCSRMSDEAVCPDCEWWIKQSGGEDPLKYNHSVFAYNEKMQEMIAKWKYRGDYILGNAFKQHYLDHFTKKFASILKDVVVIPIPLSNERQLERGFNQAQVLADFLQIPKKNVLTRKHGEKQSKKTRRERIHAENPFELRESINKAVILADDIYTTGTTLRHAANLLKQHGCQAVYAYTLVRG